MASRGAVKREDPASNEAGVIDPQDPFSDLELQQAINLRWTLRDIRAKRWKLLPIDETHLGEADPTGPRRNEGGSTCAHQFGGGGNCLMRKHEPVAASYPGRSFVWRYPRRLSAVERRDDRDGEFFLSAVMYAAARNVRHIEEATERVALSEDIQ
jgi:hypothetical protein